MSDSGHGVQGDGAGQGSEGEARGAERMLDGERRGLIHCAPPIYGNKEEAPAGMDGLGRGAHDGGIAGGSPALAEQRL